MQGSDLPVTGYQSLERWRNALRGLPDNPIANYMRLAHQRRYSRTSWWKRYSLAVLLLVCAVLFDWALLDSNYSSGLSALDQLALHPEVLCFIATLTGLLVSLGWAAQGLYAAILDVMCVMGREGRRPGWMRLDDMLATTSISDTEVVAGVLYVVFVPVLLRVLVCAALYTLTLQLALFVDSTGFLAMDFISGSGTLEYSIALVFSPLTFLILAVSGAVAAACLLSFLLALGRGLPATAASSSAVFILMAQWVYGGVMTFTAPMLSQAQTELDASAAPGAALIATLVLLLLIYALLSFGHSSQPMRYVSAIGSPLILFALPVLAITLLVIFGVNNFHIEDWEEFIAISSLHYASGLGALITLNPFALPHPFFWGVVPYDYQATGGANNANLDQTLYWLRPLLLCGLQCALLALGLHYARLAVHAHRREVG